MVFTSKLKALLKRWLKKPKRLNLRLTFQLLLLRWPNSLKMPKHRLKVSLMRWTLLKQRLAKQRRKLISLMALLNLSVMWTLILRVFLILCIQHRGICLITLKLQLILRYMHGILSILNATRNCWNPGKSHSKTARNMQAKHPRNLQNWKKQYRMLALKLTRWRWSSKSCLRQISRVSLPAR